MRRRPKSFEIDVLLNSPDSLARQRALIDAAKKGCFLEQTPGQANTIRHRLRTEEGFVEA
ncbi:MAG: hypothetical protein AAF264_01145 [Pseudomonadota bacterium]